MQEARHTSLVESWAGPALADLKAFSEDMAQMKEWRREPDLTYHDIRSRRRHLSEQRNLHLMEMDLQEFRLGIEQRNVRIRALAHAAEIERQLDPETRKLILDYTTENIYAQSTNRWNPNPSGFAAAAATRFNEYPRSTQSKLVRNTGPPPRKLGEGYAPIFGSLHDNGMQCRTGLGRQPLQQIESPVRQSYSSFFPQGQRTQSFGVMNID
jgi:hypothetical protein